MDGGKIRFAADDLELFRRASHDCNPLHESASFTRRTPFGEPVVFGMLAVLAGPGSHGSERFSPPSAGVA